MASILISFTCTDFVSIYVLLRLYLDPNMPFGTQFVIIYMKDLKIIHIYRRPIPTIHEGNAQSISWSLSKGGYYIDQFLGLKGSGTGWWWFQLRASRHWHWWWCPDGAIMERAGGHDWAPWALWLAVQYCCSVLPMRYCIAHVRFCMAFWTSHTWSQMYP